MIEKKRVQQISSVSSFASIRGKLKITVYISSTEK